MASDSWAAMLESSSSWPMAPDSWLVPALVFLATAAVVLYQQR